MAAHKADERQVAGKPADRRDYYEELQVSAAAEPLMITKAFRVLASLYHPDNKRTGDRERFERIVAAYRTLSDPISRAAYDRDRLREHAKARNGGPDGAAATAGAHSNGRRVENERALRLLVLSTLYNVRRNGMNKSGLPLRVIAEMTDASLDDVQFTLWYLRGKNFIVADHEDGMVITVAGVDFLEANHDEIVRAAVSQFVLPEATLPTD